jgi:enoyl-[acyl-carrier protein] reductase I
MQTQTGFLAGKRALIVGLASNRSIAYGIAQAMHAQGATLGFSYQNERLRSRVEKFATTFAADFVVECDVSDDAQIDAAMAKVKAQWGTFDILVHSVAYAPQDQLSGNYLDSVTREGFRVAHDISSYSLAALTKAAKPLLNQGGAVVTLSYIGSNRTIPCYNTMGVAKASLEANVRYLAASLGPLGIRVNAVSAGPIRTLASAGIKHFRKMLDHDAAMTPIGKNVTIEQVGNVSAFLCSDLASGITGEIVNVDHGFHMVGLSQQALQEVDPAEA